MNPCSLTSDINQIEVKSNCIGNLNFLTIPISLFALYGAYRGVQNSYPVSEEVVVVAIVLLIASLLRRSVRAVKSNDSQSLVVTDSVKILGQTLFALRKNVHLEYSECWLSLQSAKSYGLSRKFKYMALTDRNESFHIGLGFVTEKDLQKTLPFAVK